MRIKPHLNGALLYVCQISLTSRFQPKPSHFVSLHDTFRFCDYKTVAENLARLRQTAKEQISGTEYIRKQKSSKTEVPILPIDILNNSDKYFYELGEQN